MQSKPWIGLEHRFKHLIPRRISKNGFQSFDISNQLRGSQAQLKEIDACFAVRSMQGLRTSIGSLNSAEFSNMVCSLLIYQTN